MAVQDWADDSTWQSLGFWVGVGIQIYIAVLKSAWKKLTLSGSVIHPALGSTPVAKQNINTVGSDMAAPTAQTQNTAGHVFCGECGRENKGDAQFCENCGHKL